MLYHAYVLRLTLATREKASSIPDHDALQYQLENQYYETEKSRSLARGETLYWRDPFVPGESSSTKHLFCIKKKY